MMARVQGLGVKGCRTVRRLLKVSRIQAWRGFLAPFLLVAVLTTPLMLTGCGGGGGGGGGGGNQRILNGVNGIRQLANQNPRLAAQINNVGQLQDLIRDFTTRPINQRNQGRPTTPQEAVFNVANALSDEDTVNIIRQRYPNALTLGDFGTEIDFDNVPSDLDWWLSGILDESDLTSRQARPKLFKGKMRVRTTATTANTKEVEVTCPQEEPLEVTPTVSGGSKLKLIGGLKAKIPTNVQPNQPTQCQIDYDALQVEDRSQTTGNQKGDTVVLGNMQKQEWSPVMIKLDQDDDDIPSFDIEAIDWGDVEVSWLDDDLLTYFESNLVEAYLTWIFASDGFWYIYDEVDSLDCAGLYGADWNLSPLPRSRRQAELLLPFEFIWDDTLGGCGDIDDYQLGFFADGINYIVDALEEGDYLGWCEETDTELDAYLAALLNLPPGADLADTVLTAEAWATGLPDFMNFLHQLHLRLGTGGSGVSIEGDYPSNYTAIFSNFNYGGLALSGKATFQYEQRNGEDWQLAATFDNFKLDEVKINGTLSATFNRGVMNIQISNFAWDIPNESQGNVPRGALESSLTFTGSEITQIRTTSLDMSLNVRNLAITPPQTYNITLSLVQPLTWPVQSCDYSTEGVLRINGTVAGQSVQIQVDFGSDGECGKAIITSGGRSAKYDLEAGLFVELTRLRGKTRSFELPQPRSMRFWLNRS